MKITFDSKIDGEGKLRRAIKADQVFGILFDLNEWLYANKKVKGNISLNVVHSKLHELMRDNDIDLDRDYT